MSPRSQKRTAISRLSKNRRSLFRKIEIEDHQSVRAALECGDQPGPGALMSFMAELGRAGGGIAEIDGEAMAEAARERLGTDIGTEVDGVHAVDHLSKRLKVGMDRRALAFGDIAAKPGENTVPDHLFCS